MSFLDAFQGYHWIALATKDQEKTAFISPDANYHYTMMPFGLCAFGVGAGKFLGYMTHRGIEVNPDQIKAVERLRSPSNLKEVQVLTSMIVALNRFISKFSKRCHPFYQLLEKWRGF